LKGAFGKIIKVIAVTLISLTILIVAIFISFKLYLNRPFPSDKIIAEFEESHSRDLSTIKEMIVSDSNITAINEDRVLLSDNREWNENTNSSAFSNERWKEYKSILKDLNITIIHRTDDNAIYFTIATRGLATGGAEKGLVFSKIPLAPLTDSLDDEILPKKIDSGVIKENQYIYKSLRNGWYIYYSFDR